VNRTQQGEGEGTRGGEENKRKRGGNEDIKISGCVARKSIARQIAQLFHDTNVFKVSPTTDLQPES